MDHARFCRGVVCRGVPGINNVIIGNNWRCAKTPKDQRPDLGTCLSQRAQREDDLWVGHQQASSSPAAVGNKQPSYSTMVFIHVEMVGEMLRSPCPHLLALPCILANGRFSLLLSLCSVGTLVCQDLY